MRMCSTLGFFFETSSCSISFALNSLLNTRNVDLKRKILTVFLQQYWQITHVHEHTN